MKKYELIEIIVVFQIFRLGQELFEDYCFSLVRAKSRNIKRSITEFKASPVE